MAESGVAVAGNLAQGNWKGAAFAATGLVGIPGGATGKILSKSKLGGKLLGKIGKAQTGRLDSRRAG